MNCIYCGHKTRVTNSRHQKRNNKVWRRRQCLSCKSIFTTNESIDMASALLVDKNGSLEPFLDDILFTEVLLAIQDRKDAYTASRDVTDTVIANLLKLPQKPVFTPALISREAAAVLSLLDRRAWMRFAAEHPSLHQK